MKSDRIISMKCINLVVLSIVIGCAAKKKDGNIAYKEFLENEERRLSKGGFKCSLKKVTRKSIENLRLVTEDDITASCIIQYLKDFPDDGFLWSSLGTIFSKNTKLLSQSNACFKQAVKHTGKHTPFIKDWHFIGPFVMGKMELDGDPIEAFGGIQNVSRYRLQKGSAFCSEIMPNGEVKWSTYNQKSSKQFITIRPELNWNDLVSSIGSMGITEWQGWIVGDFAVNEENLNFVVQCMGVSTVYIDGKMYVGDLYHREKFSFGVALDRGTHTLQVRLRAKVTVTFRCILSIEPKNFEIFVPTYLPDLYDGYVFGRYLSFPIANYHPSKWLKNFRITVTDQSEGGMLEMKPLKNELAIAPGQVKPIHVKIVNESPKILSTCKDIEIEITISTSEGQQNFPLDIRCRKLGESFLFTFLDHDGSIQHGAAVRPIRSCPGELCPIVLSLHGTTVPPQNQADSYKKMVDTDYEFGVENAWLVAPTRHGAHNWEGPGPLTAMSAMLNLAEIVKEASWISDKADPDHVVFAGHSMGGHGSWHLATHYPDRALGVVSLASWIKKEEYGDSNLFFKHDIATSHADAAVKSVMEACISENDVDRHVSNLQGIPVLARIGSDDRTVHPFYVRRMYRLLSEYRVPVNYTEMAGKEHWWWDTWKTNDGGVVNDPQLRKFKADVISAYLGNTDSCSANSASCRGKTENKYTEVVDDTFTLTVMNPALGEGLRGARILQQIVPFRTSRIEGRSSDNEINLVTQNVRRFRIVESDLRKIEWMLKTVKVDDTFILTKTMLMEMKEKADVHLCRLGKGGDWALCQEDLYSHGERGPLNLGPARRVAENPFIIVTGTKGSTSTTQTLLTAAAYIANQFLLTSDTTASIVRDTDMTLELMANRNLIVLGTPLQNLLSQDLLSRLPVSVCESEDCVQLQDCRFSNPRTGLLTLAPNGDRHLAMVLMGLSDAGLLDIISLATPTIPPMARSPFSNLIPDYVITGPDFGWKGPGGFLCSGFYGNKWEYRTDISSCVCQY